MGSMAPTFPHFVCSLPLYRVPPVGALTSCAEVCLGAVWLQARSLCGSVVEGTPQ